MVRCSILIKERYTNGTNNNPLTHLDRTCHRLGCTQSRPSTYHANFWLRMPGTTRRIWYRIVGETIYVGISFEPQHRKQVCCTNIYVARFCPVSSQRLIFKPPCCCFTYARPMSRYHVGTIEIRWFFLQHNE